MGNGRTWLRDGLLTGALALVASGLLLPFCWTALTSLKSLDEVGEKTWIPSEWHPENYLVVLGVEPLPGANAKAFEIQFARWYFNSLFVAAWVTALTVTTSALAAFAFARLAWPGRDTVFFLYLATMMVPALVTSIPNFAMMFELGLYNTYAGLIVPCSFSAFGTFLLRQFMLGLPKSLDEAAEIDGAGPWRVLWDVTLPLARPGLLTLAIFTFMGNWGSFLWPLVMTKDEAVRTLPVGMLAFNSQYGQMTNLMMAGSILAMLPVIAVFVLLQRHLVAGIQLGGVKG